LTSRKDEKRDRIWPSDFTHTLVNAWRNVAPVRTRQWLLFNMGSDFRLNRRELVFEGILHLTQSGGANTTAPNSLKSMLFRKARAGW